MSTLITVSESLTAGQPVVIESPSPFASYAVVFEDDGETGYFYALDLAKQDNPIEDAVHIYNVADVEDGDEPSELKIGWSEDGAKVVLLINDYPHAVFNFAAKRGYCRNNFPPPAGEWAKFHRGHAWDDAVLAVFGEPVERHGQ
jgi:hypothetical protein